MSLGVGGAVEMGAHVCGFFFDEARRAEILDAFIAEAVRAGDKCYCLLDAPHPSADHPAAELLTTTESYLSGGRFSARAMLGRLEQLVTRALEEGYPAVRAVGEMSWAAEAFPGADEVCLYEAEVNRFAPRHPQVLLCLYDLSRFTADAVVEVLRTHPWMLVADVVLANPYYSATRPVL